MRCVARGSPGRDCNCTEIAIAPASPSCEVTKLTSSPEILGDPLPRPLQAPACLRGGRYELRGGIAWNHSAGCPWGVPRCWGRPFGVCVCTPSSFLRAHWLGKAGPGSRVRSSLPGTSPAHGSLPSFSSQTTKKKTFKPNLFGERSGAQPTGPPLFPSPPHPLLSEPLLCGLGRLSPGVHPPHSPRQPAGGAGPLSWCPPWGAVSVGSQQNGVPEPAPLWGGWDVAGSCYREACRSSWGVRGRMEQTGCSTQGVWSLVPPRLGEAVSQMCKWELVVGGAGKSAGFCPLFSLGTVLMVRLPCA